MADKNAEVAVEDNGGMKKTGWSWAAVPFPL